MDQKIIVLGSRKDIPVDYDFITILDPQLYEIAEVRNPKSTQSSLEIITNQLRAEISPVYVLYPWRNLAVEMLPKKYFYELKTNRNQLLINNSEQKTLYNSKISIAGMSVGSSLLYGLVGCSIGNELSIADDDVFSNTNLNRVQATVLDIGSHKVEIAYRRATEMNPFLNITTFIERITEKNCKNFMFDGDASLIFEEIDDFKMKVIMREHAKKHRIPLVMLTNLGDNVQIDVERYDTQPDTELFNGKVESKVIEKIRSSDITTELMKKLSLDLVDSALVSQRATDTLQEVGVTLVGRPQLYSTVAMNGGVAPYIARRILLEDNLASGRYALSLSAISS